MDAAQQALKEYEALLIKKKLKGLDDLFFFNRFILTDDPERRKLVVPHVHGEWTTWFNTAQSRVRVILVPRSCFKSTFFTVGWSLQQIAKNPNVRILIANATLANSQRFVGEIKDNIRNNETFKMLYGDMYDPKLKWNEDEIVVKGRSRSVREATVTAAGVGGNLVSQHYDIIIGDDLVNNENSATKYQTDKVIDWWKKSFSLLEPNGIMLLIGTRWSYRDLYSELMAKYKKEFDFYIKGAKNPNGSFYFPERFNEAKLKELKNLHGSYIYSCFYLNNPVDEDTALIKQSQIKYYGPECDQKLPQIVNTFSMCDPAISQESGSDYSTIVTASVDQFNNRFVREVRRGKWTTGQLIEELFSVKRRWDPITMSIELIGQAQVLLQPIHEEEERRKVFLPLVVVKARPQYKKLGRIRAIIQPWFEQGKIFIPKGEDDLEEELTHFPQSAHDDIIDPLTDLDDMAFAPSPEESNRKKSDSYFESQLKDKSKSTPYVDDVLGEYF